MTSTASSCSAPTLPGNALDAHRFRGRRQSHLRPVHLRRDAVDHVIARIAWADYIVLALPLTAETHRLIGADQLALMKPTARLINVGRGDLVDEPAMIDALANGRLAGAGLDVFAVEPLPTDSPLWDMPNVIVTAHDSGATDGANRRAALIFADNLGRYARGQPLRNEVFTDVGAASAAR
jgi:phosphoglycerate dehydrogenase-like enzyme